jgi:hypothetical protein
VREERFIVQDNARVNETKRRRFAALPSAWLEVCLDIGRHQRIAIAGLQASCLGQTNWLFNANCSVSSGGLKTGHREIRSIIKS